MSKKTASFALALYRHWEPDAWVSSSACWYEDQLISIAHAISFPIML